MENSETKNDYLNQFLRFIKVSFSRIINTFRKIFLSRVSFFFDTIDKSFGDKAIRVLLTFIRFNGGGRIDKVNSKYKRRSKSDSYRSTTLKMEI